MVSCPAWPVRANIIRRVNRRYSRLISNTKIVTRGVGRALQDENYLTRYVCREEIFKDYFEEFFDSQEIPIGIVGFPTLSYAHGTKVLRMVCLPIQCSMARRANNW